MFSLPFVSLASLLVSIPQTADAERKPPGRPEAPFTVFVFAEPHGEPEIEKKILEASKAFGESIDRKKKWFLRVNARRDAEIIVEVQALLRTDETRDRMQTAHAGNRSHTSVYMVAEDSYYLYAKATLFGSMMELRGPDGKKDERDAASALAKELERRVKEKYWRLAERRELFHDPSTEVPVEELGLEWMRLEITRRVEAMGFEVELAEWSGSTLSLVIGGDEFRFPFPANGFEPCSRDIDCQGEIVAQVMNVLEEPLGRRK